jgi:hypothetical protein
MRCVVKRMLCCTDTGPVLHVGGKPRHALLLPFTSTRQTPSLQRLQERRSAELESQLAEVQQQLEAAQSSRTVTQEALDQVGGWHSTAACEDV